MRYLVLALALACGHPYRPQEGAHVEAHATAIGARAPELHGTNASGNAVALADVLRSHDQTILVFYRGFY